MKEHTIHSQANINLLFKDKLAVKIGESLCSLATVKNIGSIYLQIYNC